MYILTSVTASLVDHIVYCIFAVRDVKHKSFMNAAASLRPISSDGLDMWEAAADGAVCMASSVVLIGKWIGPLPMARPRGGGVFVRITWALLGPLIERFHHRMCKMIAMRASSVMRDP